MAEESRRQVEMRLRLEEARTRVRERTFELPRTLEHVRLKLLRMAARAGEEAELAGELTVELERADRLGTEAAELLRARDEVRRLLDPSPGGPSPDRSPARSDRSSARGPSSSEPPTSGPADGGSEIAPTSRRSSPPGRTEPHDAAD